MSVPTHAHAEVSTRIVRFQGGGLRFLEALESRVVTRPRRDLDGGQHWRVTDLGTGAATIEHVSSGRLLIADTNSDVVTTSCGNGSAILWRIEDFGGGFASIEHIGSGRFLEATVDGDFAVVLRAEGSSEQTWRLGDP